MTRRGPMDGFEGDDSDESCDDGDDEKAPVEEGGCGGPAGDDARGGASCRFVTVVDIDRARADDVDDDNDDDDDVAALTLDASRATGLVLFMLARVAVQLQ